MIKDLPVVSGEVGRCMWERGEWKDISNIGNFRKGECTRIACYVKNIHIDIFAVFSLHWQAWQKQRASIFVI